MTITLNKKTWLFIKVIICITIAIPVGILVYETIFLNKDSVVFFEGYPLFVSITIMIYYIILLLIGSMWVITQLKSLLSIKNEKKKSELLHLQSQVNPHFFFNMLNNLYGLVDKDKEKSKLLILKLSDLMRYSIYEGEKKLVFIEDEVEYLKNYIELHRMRYHKQIDIQFNIDIEKKELKLTPLLFIILLENAFKHGVENLREGAYVHIDLKANNKEICFEIKNNFDPDELPKNKGIGIKNLKRRLELIYPKKHRLFFSNNNSVFKSQIQLFI